MADVKTIEAGEIAVPQTSVVVVYPSRGSVSLGFHHAMADVERFDRANGWGNYRGELVQRSGPNIAKARNELVRKFLDFEHEWAWFVDDDMVVKPDTLPRLLCAANATGAKIIGALCVMVGESGPVPTIYQLGNLEAGEITRVAFDYPDESTVMQVAATGTGCLLVHRDVFEAIDQAAGTNPYPWFHESVINGNWTSEDLVFCLKAGELGFRVFVDCGAPVGHVKDGREWWPADIKRGRGFPDQRTVVVIPVKDKFDYTTSIVHQLRGIGGYDDLVICDNGSGTKLRNWLESQDDIITLDAAGWGIHEMWNAGVAEGMRRSGRQLRNLNFVFLNNDLELGPDCIRRMVRTLRTDSQLAAVSANYDERDIEGDYQPVTEICANRYDGTGGLAGFAFAVKGEWFHSGYQFPEDCKWWYGDNDLMLAIQSQGWKAGISPDATVVHIDKGGYNRGDWDEFAEQIEKDRQAFEARWAPRRTMASPEGDIFPLRVHPVDSLPAAVGKPFPHIVVDGLWNPDLLTAVVDEFPNPADTRWKRYGGKHEVKYEGPPVMWGPYTRKLFAELEALAPELGKVFGIDDLTMETVGGGYHLIPPGGKLDVHTDFNRSPNTSLYRRLNCLIYLNREWDDPGGNLILGNETSSMEEVPPEFNRTVVFETSDRSWHGHPVPTENRWRLSVAAYYFSKSAPPGFTKEHSTVWSEAA